MPLNEASSAHGGILVSDFDGTLTEFDFFELVRRRWPIPPERDPWNKYWKGEFTHFEALAQIFAGIRADPAELEELSVATNLDADVKKSVRALQHAGWEVIVASAGCDWYIKRLLAAADVSVTVYSNPGRVEPNGALIMNPPEPGPFFSATTGVNKLAVVQAALQKTERVAFAGDGRPDLEPALLVAPERRFARGWLVQALTERGESFHPFQRWSQIAKILTC
jgi:2,3-diketo-5-methylthio-1-phosphopentane phosphatase